MDELSAPEFGARIRLRLAMDRVLSLLKDHFGREFHDESCEEDGYWSAPQEMKRFTTGGISVTAYDQGILNDPEFVATCLINRLSGLGLTQNEPVDPRWWLTEQGLLEADEKERLASQAELISHDRDKELSFKYRFRQIAKVWQFGVWDAPDFSDDMLIMRGLWFEAIDIYDLIHMDDDELRAEFEDWSKQARRWDREQTK